MNTVKELMANKNDPQGRINLTMFFANIFLLSGHIVLMVIYILANHHFMIGANIVSLFVYSFFMFSCYKKPLRYAGIVFLEIWVHMLCAIASFGWTPCFQNWSFAIIAAYFLPAFGLEHKRSSYKSILFYTSIVIITYFVIAVAIYIVDIPIMKPLDETLNRILFTLNNLMTFFTIIMFSVFYTSNNRRKERELSRKASYDELTNMYNRYALTQLSNHIIHEAKEVKKPYSVAIMDIDFFKEVNDTHGHGSGDMVLEQLSRVLRAYSMRGIISGRWGGEEFIMICPYDIEYEKFAGILERLRVSVENRKFKIENNQEINITISIGSNRIDDYAPLEEAVSRADENLYKAKNEGRNRVAS